MSAEADKSSHNFLIYILVFFCVVIIGLTIAIVVVNYFNSPRQIFGPVSSPQMEKTINYYLENQDNPEKEALINYLTDNIDSDNNKIDIANACYYLALLKYENGDTIEAETILNRCIDDFDFSQEEEYFLLSYLNIIYEETSNLKAQKSVLEKILAFPDDMVIKYEDWKLVKQLLRVKLENLENEL